MGVYVIVPLTKLSSAGGGQLQSMDQIWPTACFFKQNFIGAQLNGFADVLSMGCFHAAPAELRSCHTETIWPAKH